MIIQGFYQPLLAGEIISLIIKIINCSSEAITNLKLSTSLQHCTLLKQVYDEQTGLWKSSLLYKCVFMFEY